MAAEYGISFFETSAKMNINVEECFQSIAKEIVKKLKDNPDYYGASAGAIYVNETNKSNNKNGKSSSSSGCC